MAAVRVDRMVVKRVKVTVELTAAQMVEQLADLSGL
jgi:hypothetical protein